MENGQKLVIVSATVGSNGPVWEGDELVIGQDITPEDAALLVAREKAYVEDGAAKSTLVIADEGDYGVVDDGDSSPLIDEAEDED